MQHQSPTNPEMAARIIMVTGGQRSGKSAFAEQLALSISDNPIYMATAKIRDDEMLQRVNIHKARRGNQWSNIEEPYSLSSHNVEGRTVLVDCLTLWVTNIFFANDENVDKSFKIFSNEFNALTTQNATFIFVTNEIGLGGVSANALQRKFTDLQGYVNQTVASTADDVYFLVSGIPMKIK